MVRTACALLATAVPLAAVDLAHKALATSDATLLHERGRGYLLLALVALAWAAALVAVRSPGLAAAGGVVLGGAAGNLLSLALWDGVPNPLVAGAVAFNLADVFAAAGGLLLVPLAAAVMARRRSARLQDPVSLRGASS
jgi:hypothetical protein